MDNNQKSSPSLDGLDDFKTAHQEEIFLHYLRILAFLLDYLGFPEETREFIEAIAIKLGFDYAPPKHEDDDTGFVFVFDGELADCVCASISLKEAAEQRLRRQRKKLWEWQAETDAEGKRRAQAVEIKRDFDLEIRQYAYRYRFPLGALIRDVAALAPVGSSDNHFTATISRQGGEFLRRQKGRKKNLPPKRTHSPESNLNRALTFLVDAFRAESRQANPVSAENLLRKTATDRLSDPKNPESSETLKTIYLILGDLVEGCDHHEHTSPKSYSSAPPAEIEQILSSSSSSSLLKTRLENQLVGEGEPDAPPVIPNALPETDQGSQGGGADFVPLDSDPDQHGEQGDAALLAVQTFKSVGAVVDQVIFKNDVTKEAESTQHITTEQFVAELTELIGDAGRGGVSLIARVRGPVLQLDDCDGAAVALLKPFAFLTVETSPKNYQCWLAFRGGEDKDAARDRLFARLRELVPGVNPGGGGALRWPGAINFKPERDGWRVRIHSINPGRVVTSAELDAAGLLADPPVPRKVADPPRSHSRSQTWPDYEKCLRSKPTRSEADAQFVWIALQRGFSEAEIAAKLAEISERAQESGERYVGRTLASVGAWNSGGAL